MADIHPKFATWLAAAKISTTDEVIRKWWTAVDTFPVDRDTAILLVEFAVLSSTKPEFEGLFLTAVQKQDAAFLPKSRLAMSVLAGATVMRALSQGDVELAVFCALAMESAAVTALPRRRFLSDMVECAQGFLDGKAATRADWDYLQNGLKNKPATADNPETLRLRRTLGVVAEETDILWWLLGETSRDTGKRFGEYGDGSVGLIAGKELGDLTQILPGHSGAHAFLDRACRSGRAAIAAEAGIGAAVAGLQEKWRKEFLINWQSKPYLKICPLSATLAATASVTSAKKIDDELPNIAGLPKAHKMEPTAIARQMYVEGLLLKAYAACAK